MSESRGGLGSWCLAYMGGLVIGPHYTTVDQHFINANRSGLQSKARCCF